jgi:hypothetical protein
MTPEQFTTAIAEEIVRIMGLSCDEKNPALYNLRAQILRLGKGETNPPTQETPEKETKEDKE